MQERYAKLNGSWLLRGWSDLPRAIVNWRTGQLRDVGRDAFYVARSCDGRTNFGSPAFLPKHIALLEKFLAEGVAEECAPGETPAASQEYRQADNPLIRSVHWAITGRCNMNCRHCFMESPAGRYGHPDRQTVLRLLDQFEQANVLQVSLTGGEPLLRDDLLDIIGELSARKIRLTEIATNGTLITASLLDAIKKLGQRPDIKISFDGTGGHDAMRGTTGTEARVIAAIGKAIDAGLMVAVSTTLARDNLGALAGTYALMKELRVPVWLLGRPQTTGNWCGGAAALSTAEMAEACLDLLRRWLDDGRPFYILLERFFGGGPAQQGEPYHLPPAPLGPESYECESVRQKPYLLPDGRLLPCVGYTGTALHEQMPSLMNRTLAEVWRTSALRPLIDMRKAQVLARNPECRACGMFAECGAGCRAYALTEAGSLLDRDPFACAVWKGGYRKKFADIVAAVAASNK